jgi:Putative outer membrane beta-barrel porin, MtrB/PioB
MRWTQVRVVGLLAAAAGLLLAAILLGLPAPVPAQRPTEPAETPVPEGYVGAEMCKGCHEDATARFATTKMGRLFLKHPRNTMERLGCETYTYEHIFQKQRSRSRPVTGTTTFDFPDFDWISDNTDTIDTIYAGARVGLIPRVLDWTVNASYAYALGRIQTRNPVAPTSGTAAQDATATAKPFPAFEDQLLRVETALSYHFWKAWTASFSYVFESFQKNDWRTDRLNPFVPGVTSIWLGNDERNYDAHWVAFTLGYRF